MARDKAGQELFIAVLGETFNLFLVSVFQQFQKIKQYFINVLLFHLIKEKRQIIDSDFV
jgi:hypothetical protein